MWKDPIVEEVRKQRLQIETDCETILRLFLI